MISNVTSLRTVITSGFKLFCTMSDSPVKKKSLIASKIGTHNGVFHCDEVLACFLLKQLPEYENSEVIRTRDEKLLETCDIVVDVGGVFDPSKNLFDHHQRTFSESMQSLDPSKKWTTKLSSAGLVYYHFGPKIITKILKSNESDNLVKIIFDKIYENFVEEIDAIDNGINISDEKPRYSINTNLSSRVGFLNPKWNEKNADEEKGFKQAIDMVGKEFMDRIHYYHDVWWPAREIIRKAIDTRNKVDPGGEIILLEQGGCPWREHLFSLEEELKIEPTIKFVIFTDQMGRWRVQCVPVRTNSFENRLSLLEEWRGLRDEGLSQVSGIAKCIFVHSSGFIGGNETKDGALLMAQKTLESRA